MMYVVAGFHKVKVSLKNLRAAVSNSLAGDSSDDEEDEDDVETGGDSELLLLVS